MFAGDRVKKTLDGYASDNPGTKANLARILMQGKLGGTGKLVILPVDQGFEHGPARSFAPNPPAYDRDRGRSLGLCGAVGFHRSRRRDLRRSHSHHPQGELGQQPGARQGGAVAGGDGRIHQLSRLRRRLRMMEAIAEMGREAKAHGLAVVIRSYPRGGTLSKQGETAMDICAYAAHMAALLGAHIIKVKPPTDFLELEAAKKVYEQLKIDIASGAARIRHVVQSCFNGRRIVVFSGGEAKDIEGVFNEARAIRDGGGNGSIIGRNTFQRPRADALKMLDAIIRIDKGEA